MSELHTPGLLNVAVEIFDNDGMPESVIQNAEGSAAVAVAIDFGPNNPLMREANARRLVACWNALIDLPQDALDGGWTRAGLEAYGIKMERQRDELLAELKNIANANPKNWDAPLNDTASFQAWAQSRALHTIAKIEGDPS